MSDIMPKPNDARRCSWCGAQIHEKWAEYDVVNPGGNMMIVVHLCDECWQRYVEVKKCLQNG